MSNERPVVDELPFAPVDRTLGALSAATVLSTVMILARSWATLPDRVPMHYGFDGRPNAWADRGFFFLLIGVLVPMNILFSVIQRMPESYKLPVRVTERNALRVYTAARRLLIVLQLVMNLVLASALVLTVLVAEGTLQGLPVWWLPAVLVTTLGVAIWGRRYIVNAS